MKHLMSITLLAALIIQLSSADDTMKAIEAPNDKLYPIYELVANRMNEYSKKEIPILGGIFTQLLQEYTTYLETHNTQEYQNFKTEIEKFLESVELLAKNPDNCELLRAAYVQLKNARNTQPNDNAVYNMLTKAGNDTEYKQEYKNLVHGFTAQFPALIKNFVDNVGDSEKQKYADVYTLAQEFLKASDENQQFRAFQNLMNKIKFTENTTSANSDNCKWDYRQFEKFEKHIKNYVFIDLDQIKF